MLLPFFYLILTALKLSILLQVTNGEPLVYGGVWENGNQRLTILCANDEAYPSLWFIANGPCARTSSKSNEFDDEIYFEFGWDSDQHRAHFIQALNERNIIPDGVGPDGLTTAGFYTGRDYCDLDAGNYAAEGETIDHDTAGQMYAAMSCEE